MEESIAPIPQRWAERPKGGAAAEDAAGALVRAIGPAAELSDLALARVKARVRAAALAGAPSPWTKPTLIGSALLLAAGAGWLMVSIAAMPSSIVPPSPALPRAVPAAPTPAPLREPPEVPAVQDPEPLAKTTRAPSKPRPAAPKPAAPALSADSRLLEESRSLGLAVRQLRKQRDATASLATLTDYFERFPDGLLRHDAQAVEIDALLALGRRKDALELLETLSRSDFAGLPRAPELRVIRAELHAALGRLDEAARAFDQALSRKSTVPELDERALFGRAGCRVRLGDPDGSQADLSLYLQRYPKGRFAAEARAALRAPAP